MGSTFYFIEAPGGPGSVLSWFRNLDRAPEETPTKRGVVLYFRHFGPLVYDHDGAVDAKRSPVVNLVLPQVRRDILWTVGEVHFLVTPQRTQSQSIDNVARSFARWLKKHDVAYDQALKAENPLGYYLEGSSKNRGTIYALPSGFSELKNGRYFVADQDNQVHLDRVCRALRLRGVVCGPA